MPSILYVRRRQRQAAGENFCFFFDEGIHAKRASKAAHTQSFRKDQDTEMSSLQRKDVPVFPYSCPLHEEGGLDKPFARHFSSRLGHNRINEQTTRVIASHEKQKWKWQEGEGINLNQLTPKCLCSKVWSHVVRRDIFTTTQQSALRG